MAGIFTAVFTVIDDKVAAFLSSKVAAVAQLIEPTAVTCMSIYIMFWGIMHILGRVEEPIMEFAVRTFKMAFISSIALGMGEYNDLFVRTFQDSPGALANALTGSNANNIGGTLDGIFNSILDVSGVFWQMGGLSNLGAIILAIVLLLVGAATTGYAAFLVALSKIATGVLLALGPLFLISLFFDAMKRWFESWIAQLVNYGLVMVLAVAVNMFFLDTFQHTAEAMKAMGGDVKVVDCGPILILAVISVLIMGQVTSIAAGLAGGLSLSSFGMGRFIGGKAMKLGQTVASAPMKPISDRMQLRKEARNDLLRSRMKGQMAKREAAREQRRKERSERKNSVSKNQRAA